MKKLSLKECWHFGNLELIPKSRTLKNKILAFIEKKTSNVCLIPYIEKRDSSLLEKIEILFWSKLEFKTRKLWNKNGGRK